MVMMMLRAPFAAALSALKKKKSAKLHRATRKPQNIDTEDDNVCIMEGSVMYMDSKIPDFLLEVLPSSLVTCV
jgi:hypothetical protein